MARVRRPAPAVQQVSGNALTASAAVHRRLAKPNPQTDRHQIAQAWQHEVYRHLNICGEARYSATLFSNIAGRAEIGVSKAQTLQDRAAWVTSGPEVRLFAELVPTVRERTRLIRTFMLHWIAVGECYLVARPRVDTDPPPYRGGSDEIWEIVSVTELHRNGDRWTVTHENGTQLEIPEEFPVIRMWNPSPTNRNEAWSPYLAMLPTLREIEFLTKHIFTQVRSRLMSAGIWFIPNNITFPAPPPDAVEGGAEAIAAMNESEQFMTYIADSSMQMLDDDEVAFPTVVMADPAALAMVDQSKLIKFWSEIDEKAMTMRSDAVRRFALGMDLPPEQVLGSSGLAVTGGGGSAGSVNHWGVWANEAQTISMHIEPALDEFVNALTASFLRNALPNTDKVIAYDTASLRMKQDRSKESIELFDRGVLKAEVMLRENGYDPETDMMGDKDRREWLLMKVALGSPTPEQMHGALSQLNVDLPEPEHQTSDAPKGLRGPQQAPNLDGHEQQGPPTGDHEHKEAPFSAFHATCEGLVIRAMEKTGNRFLNDGKRGKDRDRETPIIHAHLTAAGVEDADREDFDFSTLGIVLGDRPALQRARIEARLGRFCADLYRNRSPYTRAALIKTLEDL